MRLWGQALRTRRTPTRRGHVHLPRRPREPWGAQEKLTLWFQALGGETYFANGQIHWAAVVQYLISEVSARPAPSGSYPNSRAR
ncbi:MAG: hypothetical protein IPJ94_10985 [Chloroflexi bacterium]|nr:hypothetical protein [Chloroflexota bacterium]